MQTYFKITANFDKKIADEEVKKEREIYLFETSNYKSSEELITKYLSKQIAGEFDCDISKVKYENIIKSEDFKEDDEFYFYEVKHTILEVTEEGAERYKTNKYLFQAESLEDAVDRANEYLKDTVATDHWLSGVQELDYENVVLWDELKELQN